MRRGCGCGGCAGDADSPLMWMCHGCRKATEADAFYLVRMRIDHECGYGTDADRPRMRVFCPWASLKHHQALKANIFDEKPGILAVHFLEEKKEELLHSP